jgi:hypothetical protein
VLVGLVIPAPAFRAISLLSTTMEADDCGPGMDIPTPPSRILVRTMLRSEPKFDTETPPPSMMQSETVAGPATLRLRNMRLRIVDGGSELGPIPCPAIDSPPPEMTVDAALTP